MSTTIDQKVVEMRFDNKQFEQNVSTTMSTLEKLKQKLSFNGASKGLEELGTKANKVDMNGLLSSVDTVRTRFSALEVMGVTALANITNSAVNTGKRMLSALTIDPIKTGFSEYETKMGAIQTIMSNTASKGTTMQDVTRVINELNTYADKTIYNFAEMTRNIGTFTAAGVGLEESASAIQGIANLAAASGSTSQQASTAMYQLSQALAAGTVKLMDWNSVVNAGMGGEKFQEALKATARDHGVAVDKLIEDAGSFRESLQEGWITADILNETLNKFTVDGAKSYAKSMMETGKWTQEQADALIKEAIAMEDAATKVKTFTQLWDTLKESAQSGWSQTWEILVGDFEEAKSTLTEISDVIGGIIGTFSDRRNDLLSGALSNGWKQLLSKGIDDAAGFQETVSNVAKEHGVDLDKMIDDEHTFQDSLKEGWLTCDILTESVDKFTEKLSNMSEEELKAAGYTQETVDKMKKIKEQFDNGSISAEEFAKKMTRNSGRQNIIDAAWNAFNGLLNVLKPVSQAFKEVFPAITAEQLYGFTVKLKEFTSNLKLSGENSEKIKRIFKGVFSVFNIGKKVITGVADALLKLAKSDGISSLSTFIIDSLVSLGDFLVSLDKSFDIAGFAGFLSSIVNGISNLLESTIGPISGFGDAISAVGNFIVGVAKKIWAAVEPVFTWIRENVSVGDIFAGLAGGGIFIVARKLSRFLDKILDIFKNIFGGNSGLSEIKEKFSDILGSVHDSLNAFSTGVKVSSLVSIAIAVGILSASLGAISKLDAPDIAKSILAIGIMLGGLALTMKSVTKSLSTFGSKGVIKAGFSLILIAGAIRILAGAMEKISKLSLKEIGKALIGIGGGLIALSVGLKIIGKTKISFSTSIAILALAEACNILGDALQKFSTLSWDEIGRGLVAMGGALGEFVIAMAVMNKFGGINSVFGSIGILIAVQSLEKMAAGLKSFAEMSWDEIKRGLSAMGGALGELGITLSVLGKIAGFSSIFAASAILIAIQGLDDLCIALKSFGEMAWDEMGRGLTAMGGALLEVAGFTGALSKISGFSSIFGASAILIVIQGLNELASALKSFGEMAWDEIGRGLAAMGGALLEVAGISGALGVFAGFSGIFGGTAIWIAVQGLNDLASALKSFAELTWDEIGRGLTAMGGALLEVGGISGGLGVLTGFAGILGGASIWVTVQGLDDLASSLKKFSEMSWDEIKRGLSAMGGAMSEVAIGGLLNTLSIFGAHAISEMAGSLGILADSVKKWTGITVPEGLGDQLGSIGDGVKKFTLANLGGDNALATIAAPLGVLADSVKKWAGVEVPEGLSDKLNSLAGAVKQFTWTNMGADNLVEIASPIGTLADSIKKWTGITVPENLESNLTSLANGIKAFSWAFMGGWSISAIVTPLGDLPDSIKKWTGITVPENLESNLTSLANGIKAFSWAFMGGWSLETVVGPLGDLAGSIKKWSDVVIPEGLGEQLVSVADGIMSFTYIGDISYVTESIKSLVGSIQKLSGINYKTISVGLIEMTSAIANLNVSNSTIDSLNRLGNAIVNGILNSIQNAAIRFTQAGGNLVNSLINGINGTKILLTSQFKSLIDSLIDIVDINKVKFNIVGIEIISNFINGIISQTSRTTIVFASVLSNSITSIKGYYQSFYDAGSYLVDGFAAGITANTFKAEAKAAAMAAAALKAAKEELDEHSPSKEFYKVGDFAGKGFVNALGDYAAIAYTTGGEMAESAKTGLSKAISKITDLINSDIDTQPTIRPVLDLSDVSDGAAAINGMFGMRPSTRLLTNVGSINTMMNKRQNRSNADVISAIKDLGNRLNNRSGDTYQINGISYDDGTNVADAIKTIVRAAKTERRK